MFVVYVCSCSFHCLSMQHRRACYEASRGGDRRAEGMPGSRCTGQICDKQPQRCINGLHGYAPQSETLCFLHSSSSRVLSVFDFCLCATLHCRTAL